MQRHAHRLSIALVLGPACGPSMPAGTGDETTTTATSTGAPSDPGVTPTTGSITSASSGALPGTSSTGTTTDDHHTTDGETTTSTTTGGETTETTAAAELTTKAWWVHGNQLQIRVIQHDAEAGLCQGVLVESLIDGGGGSQAYTPVETPPEWLVHSIFVHQNLEACFDPYNWWMNEWVGPTSATGSIVFHDLDDEGRPATVDIDVTGPFAPGEPWIPALDTLLVVAVPVMDG